MNLRGVARLPDSANKPILTTKSSEKMAHLVLPRSALFFFELQNAVTLAGVTCKKALFLGHVISMHFLLRP